MRLASPGVCALEACAHATAQLDSEEHSTRAVCPATDRGGITPARSGALHELDRVVLLAWVLLEIGGRRDGRRTVGREALRLDLLLVFLLPRGGRLRTLRA